MMDKKTRAQGGAILHGLDKFTYPSQGKFKTLFILTIFPGFNQGADSYARGEMV